VKRALLTAALVAITASPAHASQLQAADGSYDTILAAAFLPSPAGTVKIDDTGCPWGAYQPGCSLDRQIWLHAHDPAVEPYAGVFLHELGHVADAVLAVDPSVRQGFRDLIGADPTIDWCPTYCERWADIYATCALTGFHWISETEPVVSTLSYAFQIPRVIFVRACFFMRDAMHDRGFDPEGQVWTAPVHRYAYRCHRHGRTYLRAHRAPHCRTRVEVAA
jgi:hypothetical protein